MGFVMVIARVELAYAMEILLARRAMFRSNGKGYPYPIVIVRGDVDALFFDCANDSFGVSHGTH